MTYNNDGPIYSVLTGGKGSSSCCAICEQSPMSGGACDGGFTPTANGQCIFKVTYNCDPQIFTNITNDYYCANSFYSISGDCSCGTRTLTCFDFGGETNWAMTNVDMGGCNCSNSTPDMGPISDPPCTVGDTYTFHHYCA